MALRKFRQEYPGFEYDVIADGGAIGAIQTELFLPANCGFLLGSIWVTQAFAEGGPGATLQITSVNGLIFSAVIATAALAINSGTFMTLSQIVPAVDQVTVTIAGANFTAGRLVCAFQCTRIGQADF